MNFNYRWKLAEAYFPKNRGKVFSCFSCGGGSTMGYKLAGFDVIGFNEIDPRMADLYQSNHKPKLSFVEPIQTFKNRTDLPSELFELDILDGSPPCSSFSMSGTRDRDWGKAKKFREGQVEQVLDTLFYDFIDLAAKLRPKMVIAENVTGILKGQAIQYVQKVFNEFLKAGYVVKEFECNASQMGVPQRRERIFFIAIREDLVSRLPVDSYSLFSEFPKLNMKFGQAPIVFDEVRTDGLDDAGWTEHDQMIWDRRIYGDKKYADVLVRVQDRHSNFNSSFIYPDKVVPTIASSQGSKYTLFDEPRKLNSTELKLVASFPLDFDFKSQNAGKIQYVTGMSVPPVMMATLVDRIYNEFTPLFTK